MHWNVAETLRPSQVQAKNDEAERFEAEGCWGRAETKTGKKMPRGCLKARQLLWGLHHWVLLCNMQKYRVCMCVASLRWSEGACSGTVYSGDEKLTKLIAKVAIVFSSWFTFFLQCKSPCYMDVGFSAQCSFVDKERIVNVRVVVYLYRFCLKNI